MLPSTPIAVVCGVVIALALGMIFGFPSKRTIRRAAIVAAAAAVVTFTVAATYRPAAGLLLLLS